MLKYENTFHVWSILLPCLGDICAFSERWNLLGQGHAHRFQIKGQLDMTLNLFMLDLQ